MKTVFGHPPSRFRVWLLASILLVLAGIWLYQKYGNPFETLSEPAPAASGQVAPKSEPAAFAPAASASAPAAATATAVATADPVVAEPTPTPEPVKPESHTVAKGETLAGIAKLHGLDWKELCVHNKLTDCHVIRPDQELSLAVSDEDKVLTKKAAPSRYFEPKNRYTVIDCSKTKLGYCVFSRPGGDPVCRADQLSILVRDFKVSKEDALAWTGVSKERKLMKAGTLIDGLSFGHGYWQGPVLVKQDMWYTEGEIAGQVIGQFDKCCNTFPVKKLSPPVPAVIPPAVVVPPEPAPEPAIPAEPEEAPLPKADAAAYEHQVDAYTGYGRVWHGDSHYGYAGFDWYLKQWVFVDEDGKTHRLGFGADYSAGSGVAGTDGKFHWDALTLRPVAYKIEGTDGKTLRLRILVTRIRDGVVADQGRYQNERTMWQWGPEVIFTDQGRKDAGHKWWSEHRFSAAVLFNFHKSGSHSWEGTPITDTTELLKVKGMVRAGARLYIYDLDGGMRTFVQAGASVQWPNVARSVGISVGIDGPDELWTVFAGPNFDLKNHTHSFGVEVSLQIGKAYLHYRGLAAQKGLIQAVECIERDGFAYNPSTGVLTSGSCPKDAAAGTVSLVNALQPQAPPQSD